jgi:hypothetical protein
MPKSRDVTVWVRLSLSDPDGDLLVFEVPSNPARVIFISNRG